MDLTELMKGNLPVQVVMIMRNTTPVTHRSKDDVYTDIPRTIVMGVIVGAEFSKHTDNERIVKGQLIFVPDEIDITKAYPGWRMQDILAESDWAIVKDKDKVKT